MSALGVFDGSCDSCKKVLTYLDGYETIPCHVWRVVAPTVLHFRSLSNMKVIYENEFSTLSVYGNGECLSG